MLTTAFSGPAELGFAFIQDSSSPASSSLAPDFPLSPTKPIMEEPVASHAPPSVVTSTHHNDYWDVGVAVTQGWRPSQEDAYAVDLHLDPQTGLLAVFDGHGGDHCALHCVEHLSKAVRETPGWQARDLAGSLQQAFLSLDSSVCNTCPSGSGTTGTVALLQAGGRVVVAGVGDSKAILLREGRIIPMTVDHRPNAPQEEARIRCAGGFVVRGRVNACLNVSRALGDAQFKQCSSRSATQQQVSPEPDIRISHPTSPNDFLILCSDGVWNSMKETSVLRFVRQRLHQGVPHAQICEQLCIACLEPCRTAYDNITVVLCTFKSGGLHAECGGETSSGASSGTRWRGGPNTSTAHECSGESGAPVRHSADCGRHHAPHLSVQTLSGEA